LTWAIAPKDLIETQAAAAKLAQKVADGFERLEAAEEKLRAAQTVREEMTAPGSARAHQRPP